MQIVRKVLLLGMVLLGVARVDAGQGAGSADNLPAYYPQDYGQIIEASKGEDGLLIYGNIAEYNWRYIIQGFKEKYPWVENVQSLDLGPSTSFERYYAESSIDKASADMMAVASPEGFHRFKTKDGLQPYTSPEQPYLPEWSYDGNGIYTISTDPMVIIYNKLAMPEDDWPDSLEDIAELAEEKQGFYRDRVTTYDATSHSFAYDIHWTVGQRNGDKAASLFNHLGSITRAESGAATMVEKVTSGEYLAGYFVSGIGVFPRMADAGRDKILGWSLIEDGTPVFIRSIGLTKNGANPNTARLFLDYVLSHEGQVAVGKGGLTPYRPDVGRDEVPYASYRSLVEDLGEDRIILVDYQPESSEQRDDFLAEWRKAFRIKN